MKTTTMNYRIEKDTMGEVQVPADKYWGAQTERSRNNFRIGPEASMPKEIIYAFAYLKKAAAHATASSGATWRTRWPPASTTTPRSSGHTR